MGSCCSVPSDIPDKVNQIKLDIADILKKTTTTEEKLIKVYII